MFDPTHIHLLINHLPLFGSFAGLVVLLYGIWKRSINTMNAAYLVLIIAAIGAGIAYLTGEPAEETVENLQGVSKDMLELHEEAGLYAVISFAILGFAALGGLILSMRKIASVKSVALIILLLGLVSFGIVARTAFIGGQIRHSEIRGDYQPVPQNGGYEEDHD